MKSKKMGSGSSVEDIKNDPQVTIFKLGDELKQKKNEISVLKQKVENLKAELLSERDKRERKNYTETTDLQFTQTKMTLHLSQDFGSFRVIWLIKELEDLKMDVRKDFQLIQSLSKEKSENVSTEEKSTSDLSKENSVKDENSSSVPGGKSSTTNSKREDSTEDAQRDNSEVDTKRKDSTLPSTPKSSTSDVTRKNSLSSNKRKSSLASNMSKNSKTNDAPKNLTPGAKRDQYTSEDDWIIKPNENTLALTGPGFQTMLESGAICMYIAEKYGKLVPAIKYRSTYYEWIVFATATLDKLVDICREYKHLEDEPSNEIQEEEKKMMLMFKTCMEYISGRLGGKGQFLCGKMLTVADCLIGCDLHFIELYRGSQVFKAYPKVEKYIKNVSERATFKATINAIKDN